MITLNLNGKDHQLDVTEDMPLLWAIRDVVGYTIHNASAKLQEAKA